VLCDAFCKAKTNSVDVPSEGETEKEKGKEIPSRLLNASEATN
jgi:hypothetical protein